MENFSFQYPSWFLVICVLVAVLFAVGLYFKSMKWDEKSSWLKPSLWALRFLSVLLIGILLLGPMIKTLLEESKEPSIVMIVDNSKSVDAWSASANVDLGTTFRDFLAGLSSDYNVDVFSMGAEIAQVEKSDTLQFQDEVTNISEALEYISDIYEGENLGAVVVASDGIFNEGKSPIYAKFKNPSPLYTVALGDTTRKKDLIAKRVFYNEVAYLSDEMMTQVDVQAYNADGERARLTVQREEGGQWTTIATSDVRLKGDNAFTTVEQRLVFDKAGVNHYRYSLSPINNESNRSNNSKDIYIEVLDARQEIGIIANAPHPDITALKQLLEQNKNYVVSVYLEAPSAQEISKLDLAIFHNLPAQGRGVTNAIQELDRLKRPRIYIVGDQTDITAFNGSQSLVSIKAASGSANKAQAVLEESFTNFTISDELRINLSNYPPLDAPFGEYQLQGNVQTLMHQQIGKIETDYPLLSLADDNGIKSAYLFGSGIWRWKLFDYVQRKDFDVLSELLDKTIVYTSTKEDKRKFRVSTSDNVYLENDDILISAELYNNNYELINDPEVSLTISNQDGEEFPYELSKSGKSYSLNAGNLPEGRYNYKARTNFNSEEYEGGGRFVVRAIQYELYDLEARHSVLYTLADQYNGKQYFLNQLDELSQEITSNDSLKPVVYQSTISKPLLDNKWLFGLLALLLVAEWFLRRYFGNL